MGLRTCPRCKRRPVHRDSAAYCRQCERDYNNERNALISEGKWRPKAVGRPRKNPGMLWIAGKPRKVPA